MSETTTKANPISPARVREAFRKAAIPEGTRLFRDYERCKQVLDCIGDREDYEVAVRIAAEYVGV
jgi:hypothetical protein